MVRYTDENGDRLLCAEPACETEIYCRNMCKAHYERAYRRGHPRTAKRSKWVNADGSRVKCSETGCETGVASKGLCAKHYRLTGYGSTCSIPGCDGPLSSRGWCAMHYARWKRHGSTDVPALKSDKGCVECGGKYYSRGWCREHFRKALTEGRIPGKKKCSFETCENYASALGFCPTHYAQEKRGVDLTPVSPDVPCPVFGCENRKRPSSEICGGCNQTRWRYGLSVPRFIEMRRPENYVCGNLSCGVRTRLHFDHDHSCCNTTRKSGNQVSCGKCVRGWLCLGCNTSLGKLRDDPGMILGLLEYLEENKKTPAMN